MKKSIFTLVVVLLVHINYAQVGINADGSPPASSAMLDVESSTQGFLPPRLSTVERDAISNPDPGLMIYNTDIKCIEFYNGSGWVCGGNCHPSIPTAGISAPLTTQISWNWNAVSGASGYKYNTSNHYATAIDAGNATSYVQTGLVCAGTPYSLYVWAYDACGESDALTLNSATTGYKVGDTGPAGGIVFWVDPSNCLIGLEATTSNQGVNVAWGCQGSGISGADGIAIGTGAQNTIDIMNGCSTSGIAARLCDAYSEGGYDDWFLPSKNELYEIYVRKAYFTGLLDKYYWSSSEGNDYGGLVINPVGGGDSNYSKGFADNAVRCVRSFN